MRMKSKYIKRSVFVILTAVVACSVQKMDVLNPAENTNTIAYTVDLNETHQTIHNFGASDAWSIQFVGKNWPQADRENIARLLFSTDSDQNGKALGIGLSAWRFNIGGGSADQGSKSRISDEWRRSECFLEADGSYNWSKQSGQQWFLKQAKSYGVRDFVGFVNSPPIYLTKNGNTWSADGLSANLSEENAEAYSDFLVSVIKGLKTQTGVELDYLSPFNEPQWEWTCCKQEGSPWNNAELAAATRVISKKLTAHAIDTKIDLTEAGQINYLFETRPVNARSNQLSDLFHPDSENYLLNLNNVAPKVCAHSYWSTWDHQNLLDSRKNLRKEMSSVNPDLEYWMSEYCMLEDNKEIKGEGRDLGINAALYMAKVIQADLVLANASAWHWWLAVSPYDYKDGLIYIDKNKQSGQVYQSKMLWTLGNFSRYIRPESKRVELNRKDGDSFEDHLNELSASAYLTPEHKLIVVHINQSFVDQSVTVDGLSGQFKTVTSFVTSAATEDNLRKTDSQATTKSVFIPARSIVTCVYE